MSKKIRGVYVNAIVIRLEDSVAVCRKESKSIIEINRNLLPPGTKEGDVLQIIGKRISIDLAETSKRRNKTKALIDDIMS